MEFLIIILVLIAITVLLGRAFLKRLSRGQEVAQLEQDGVLATATVVKKITERSAKAGKTYYLSYRFVTATGEQHTHRTEVPYADWNRYQEGQTIDVVYLPANPRVNAVKASVETAGGVMNPPGI